MTTQRTQSLRQRLALGPLTLILTVIALLTGVSAITAELLDVALVAYIMKPVTIGLIIVMALVTFASPSPAYKWAILIGLLFSLAGDILLMIPEDLFLCGLIAFAIAQVAYIAAFSSSGGFYRDFRSAVALLLYGVLMAALMWSGLREDGVLIPALIYLAVILTMVWQAYGQWRQQPETRSMLAFTGALLFVASDSFLAANRFAFDLGQLAPILILGTYYPAQWLIAQSAGRRHL